MEIQSLRKDELVSLELRKLYETYGYKKYRMTKFEEYSMYISNKKFLSCDNLITFNSADGKLMALRPDVTLSIVKNSKATATNTEKVFYTENIYRFSKENNEHKEIKQMGVETIGKIDVCALAEMTILALRSLSAVDDAYILSISHMGFVKGLIDSFKIGQKTTKLVLESLKAKNMHAIDELCEYNKLDNIQAIMIKKLIAINGKFEDVKASVSELICNNTMQVAFNQMDGLFDSIKYSDLASKCRIDFSILNDIDYYNGIVYNGYINNIPKVILSGGQYDKLVESFGRGVGALGFAMYLGDIINFYRDEVQCADCIVLYDANTNIKCLIAQVEELRGLGNSVRLCNNLPNDFRYNKVLRLENEQLVEVDNA